MTSHIQVGSLTDSDCCAQAVEPTATEHTGLCDSAVTATPIDPVLHILQGFFPRAAPP